MEISVRKVDLYHKLYMHDLVEHYAEGINTSYLTDSYIGFTLNMESGQNFCSNRSIRSSTYGKKNIFEIPPCGKLVIFVTEFVIFLKTTK